MILIKLSFAITAPKLYRYNEILFFRLRTGYIKLNSYLNKIGLNPTNLCDTCQQEETVEHFLLNCKLYDTYRKTMIDRLLQLGVTNFNLLNVLMSSLYRGLNTYIFLKLKECLASLSATSFPFSVYGQGI
jgi:hypothetical protein